MIDLNICGFNFENVVKHKNEFEIEIEYGQGYFSTKTNYFFTEEKKKEMLILLLFLNTYEENVGAKYYRMSDELQRIGNVYTDKEFDKLIYNVYNISVENYGNDKDKFIDSIEDYINWLYIPNQIYDDDRQSNILEYNVYYYNNKGQKQEIKLKSIDISYFL